MSRDAFAIAAFLAAMAISADGSDSKSALGGYSKTFAVCSWPSEIAGTPALPATWSAHDALRLKLDWAPAASVSFSLAYGLAPQFSNPAAGDGQYGAARRYRIDDARKRIYPWAGDGGHLMVQHNLDRAYVRLSRGPVDYFIGRQAVAWGSARVVNPTDVVAPFPFTELDSEERVGVDALKAVFQIDDRSFVETGGIAGRGSGIDSCALFLRAKMHWFQSDVTPCLSFYRDNLMAGLDLAGSIGGAGAWLEAAYTRYRLGEESLEDLKSSWRVTAGCDYRLSQSIYSFIEYHFNGDGENDPAFYWQNSGKPGFRDGPVYLMGRHYLIPSLAWQIHPLLNSSTMPLVNLGDLSCLLSQSFEFNVTQDSYLSAGVYAPLGEKCRPSLHGFTAAATEFGSYPLILFMSYGCYF